MIGAIWAQQLWEESSQAATIWWAVVLCVAAVAISGLVLHVKRRRNAWKSMDEDAALPPLFFSPRTHASGDRTLTPARPWRMRPLVPNGYGGPSGAPNVPVSVTTAPAAPMAPVASGSPLSAASAPGAALAGAAAPAAPAAPSSTVRFVRPPDGTLQLLPGRLEIVSGEENKQDIRFIRSRGEVPSITFGRSEGPPHIHVQLRASTVSRLHARMQYEQGRWKLVNLSVTNPAVVNGEEMDAVEGSRVLEDGDRIEMGEVAFRFRER
ncbi:MAG: FHA domain-containing protein [Gemmatimonadaceae bacterium]